MQVKSTKVSKAVPLDPRHDIVCVAVTEWSGKPCDHTAKFVRDGHPLCGYHNRPNYTLWMDAWQRILA